MSVFVCKCRLITQKNRYHGALKLCISFNIIRKIQNLVFDFY